MHLQTHLDLSDFLERAGMREAAEQWRHALDIYTDAQDLMPAWAVIVAFFVRLVPKSDHAAVGVIMAQTSTYRRYRDYLVAKRSSKRKSSVAKKWPSLRNRYTKESRIGSELIAALERHLSADYSSVTVSQFALKYPLLTSEIENRGYMSSQDSLRDLRANLRQRGVSVCDMLTFIMQRSAARGNEHHSALRSEGRKLRTQLGMRRFWRE